MDVVIMMSFFLCFRLCFTVLITWPLAMCAARDPSSVIEGGLLSLNQLTYIFFVRCKVSFLQNVGISAN